MVDVIIILIVIVLIIFAIKGSVKHFKGEGPCCSGSARGESKTLSGLILGQKDVKISGMSCDKCVARVQNALNRIDGLSAEVELKTDTAHVKFTRLVSDDEIKKAVEAAGYKVADVK